MTISWIYRLQSISSFPSRSWGRQWCYSSDSNAGDMEADWDEVSARKARGYIADLPQLYRIVLPSASAHELPTPASTLAFDTRQELLWVGNEYVSGYTWIAIVLHLISSLGTRHFFQWTRVTKIRFLQRSQSRRWTRQTVPVSWKGDNLYRTNQRPLEFEKRIADMAHRVRDSENLELEMLTRTKRRCDEKSSVHELHGKASKLHNRSWCTTAHVQNRHRKGLHSG